MQISVIIPTYNRQNFLRETLLALNKQTFDFFEVIAVDDGSDDQIIIPDNLKYQCQILKQKHAGQSAARNLGIKKAKANIIAFTDDDCLPAQDWLQKINDYFQQRPKAIGVRGKIIFNKDGYKASFPDRKVDNLDASKPMTANIAYRKNILTKIGGFNEQWHYLEDKELCLRALKYGQINPDESVVVYHQYDRWTIKNYLRTAKNTGNWVKVIKKYSSGLDPHNPFPLTLKRILFARDYIFLLGWPLLLPYQAWKFFACKKEKKMALFFSGYILYWYVKRAAIWRASWQQKIFIL